MRKFFFRNFISKHPYMTMEKPQLWLDGPLLAKYFNMLPRLVTAFLPRSKRLLISWLQSPSAVILEPPQKYLSLLPLFPLICHEVMEPGAMLLVYWILHFKPAVSLFSFTLIKRLFSSSSLSAIRYHLHIWSHSYFSPQFSFQLVIHPDCFLHDESCM